MNNSVCKVCGRELEKPFLDLGSQPLCNKNIKNDEFAIEETYPLEVYFCKSCRLVQLNHNISPSKIFNDYTYLSSYSQSWVNHAKEYSCKVIDRFNLNSKSMVVEIASNDGYLLKNFLDAKVPAIGIEPSQGAAELAKLKGVDTLIDFFNSKFSKVIVNQYGKADLVITNNVLAHVPKINDFIKGISELLGKSGVWTIEVPYLKNLIELNQFDTIYHEHYYYFSVTTLLYILKNNNLKIIDIEKLNTHGGSLRVYATHLNSEYYSIADSVNKFLREEEKTGMNKIDYYNQFSNKIDMIKKQLNDLLINLKTNGKIIAGYGAPGKGNTLLNFLKINNETIKFTVDKNPLKQNTLLPGSRIPVYSVEKISQEKPDYIIILPWNLKEEIIEEIKFIKEWGGKFILPIPKPIII